MVFCTKKYKSSICYAHLQKHHFVEARFIDAVSTNCNKTYKSYSFEEYGDSYEKIVDSIEKNIDIIFCFPTILVLLLGHYYIEISQLLLCYYGFDNISDYIEVLSLLVLLQVTYVKFQILVDNIIISQQENIKKLRKTYPVSLNIKVKFR